MAALYVRSTDGNNADNGSTWALAKATIASALTAAASGDTVYVSQVHAETTAGANVTHQATGNLPIVKLICGNDAAQPPTAVATTATATITGTGTFILRGNIAAYGITWLAGTGSTRSDIDILEVTNTDWQHYENCSFQLPNTNAGSTVYMSTVSGGNVRYRNCSLKFAATGQGVQCYAASHWSGGSVLAGSSAITLFIKAYSTALGGLVLFEGMDLSNCATALVLAAAPTQDFRVIFRNCKLPASWSGTLTNGSWAEDSGRAEMYNCDSGNTNYRLWIDEWAGSVKSETTIVRTGGASDGVTPLAWKMTSTSNVGSPFPYLASPEIAIYNTTTGSSKTATVEIVHDSLTALTDAEVWLEVNYLGNSSFPLGTQVTDAVADPITTPASQASSSVTWTTTGLTNPNKRALSVTFTPQKKGYFQCRVILAKALTTVYVDPLLTVT